VLTARRAAQHFRLSSADDACEHLYILTVRSSLGPSPPNAGRYTVASRFRCRSCERGYIFPRAPEQFVTSPLCLVGYVRWDARSDRAPPLQTIIFSSFTGRTPDCRQYTQNILSVPTTPFLDSFRQADDSPRACLFALRGAVCAPCRPPPDSQFFFILAQRNLPALEEQLQSKLDLSWVSGERRDQTGRGAN
jgi:hypothetical protein